MRGTVKWFNDSKGYGFLAVPDMPDVYVHWQAIEGDGFKTLAEDQQVDFDLHEDIKGPIAKNVRKVQ